MPVLCVLPLVVVTNATYLDKLKREGAYLGVFSVGNQMKNKNQLAGK